MPEIALQSYLEEVGHLIEESRLVEAAGHCRHILEQYPRHVETYRLLGKALLEQGKFEDATDVFRRVLSAAPHDFIAHAALAIAFKGQDRLKIAAWHLERAFEMDPYNVAIREALVDIYSRRDGRTPEQITLTRGALARLYVRGELYDQAIAELHRLLDENGDRIDLEVLLAEALWRDEQPVDAVELCTGILERLPDCIEANAILADVWLLTDRVDEAQPYLRRVFDMVLPSATALDDYSPLGRAFNRAGAMSLPEEFMVEPLSDQVALDMEEEAHWAQRVDAGDDQKPDTDELEWLDAFVGVDDDGSDFDWLRDVDAPEGEPAASAEPDEGDVELDSELEGATTWLAQSSDRLPGMGGFEEETDWEAWLESEQQKDEVPASGSQEGSSEFEEVHMGTRDEMGKNRDEFPEDDTPDTSGTERPEDSVEDVDWLDELGETTPEPGRQQGEDEEDELPDWLTDDDTLLEDAGQELDWLGEEEEETSPELEDAGETPGGQLPDWLQDEMEESAGEPEDAADEDLSWLDQIAAGEGEAIEEPPTMSWPESESDVSAEDPTGTTVPDAPVEAGSPEGGAAGQSDDGDSGKADEVPEDLEEAMAWLEQLAAQQGAPMDELPSLEDLSDEDEEALLEEMPDDLDSAMSWLEDLAEQEEAEGRDVDEWPAGAASEEDVSGLEMQEPEGEPADDWLEELAQEEDAFAAEFEADDVGEAGEIEEPTEEAPVDWLDELAEAEEAQDAAQDSPLDETPEPEEQRTEWPDELTQEDVDELSPELEEALEGESDFVEPFAQEEDLERDDDEQDVGEAPEDLDDAMAWLEQLAAEQGAPADELPSLQGDREDEALESEPPASADEPDFAEAEAAEMPADELDWLDELGEGGDVDETPPEEEPAQPESPLDSDLFGRPAAEGEGPVQGEAPEETDEAMAWLEELAARQGASADELPSLDALSASEEMEAQSLEELDEIPDDPEEALAWLESLAGEGEDAAEGADVAEEETTPPVPHDVAAARAEAEAILRDDDLDEDVLPEESEILDDMPDDPDEAMAWLEQLAARQGAPLDELPSVEAMEEDVEVPERAEQEQDVVEDVEPSLPEEAVEEEPEAVSDELAAEAGEAPDLLDEAEEELPVTEADVAAGDVGEVFSDLDTTDEEVDEALPDWLTLEREDEVEELGWEETAGGVSDWLEAEDEAAEQETTVPDLEEPPETAVVEEEPAQEEVEETVEAPEATTPSERPPIPESVDAERLEAARRALDTGDLEAAETAYRQTLEAGDNLSFLISELEATVESHPRLMQLLGDVYMRNGQLQKALDAYRGALKSL